MAFSSQISPSDRAPGHYAVYSGCGQYVSSVHVCGATGKTIEFVYFGDLRIAASLDRGEALRACHAARRAGYSAWLVRHPANALGSSAGRSVCVGVKA